MSWKKHLVAVPQGAKLQAALDRMNKNLDNQTTSGAGSKYISYLPEVYEGPDNRVERYTQYENMDKDPEVNYAIDTIADFCTQTEEAEKEVFNFTFYDDATDAEIEVLNEALRKWTNINKFKQRIWRIFRSTIMYGDQFFLRHPETFELFWINPEKVENVIVNEADGKSPEEYTVQDVDLNIQSMVASLPTKSAGRGFGAYAGVTTKNAGAVGSQYTNASGAASRFEVGMTSMSIDAEHIIHLSLSEGLDVNWPFGNSVLEPIFKPFKQKELLEDAVVIYRIQRAPERRVFYVDVGTAPPHKAMEFVNKIKNDIHQRRIPSQTGGGTNITDAAYNPLSMIEDYFFPQTAEGRGSRVDTLPGGENLGEIDDLKWFNSKMLKGLKVPPMYMPSHAEENTGSHMYNDGRVGSAYIQEFKFAKHCKRLQNLLNPVFDREFKLFLIHRGIQIDASLFDLELHEPQNFSKYRQIEIDSAQINVFQPLSEVKYLSKRFVMKRFLNLSEDEIIENEIMWKEENAAAVKDALGTAPSDEDSGGGLSSVGVRPEPEMGADIPEEMPDEGEEGLESPISGTEEGGTEEAPEADLEL